MSSEVIYSAGFSICPESGQIKVGHETLSLSPVNMKVLLVLLRNQGKVVSRAEFYEYVWGNQIVSDDALTRCISDLRTQLGSHTDNTQLIETLPKRGYRWLAAVKYDTEELQAPPVTLWKQQLGWILFGFIFLILLSTTLLWFINVQSKPSTVRVALLPIQVNDSTHKEIATELEDLLREDLLNTKQLRFLSRSAIANRPSNPYPYLFRELGAQWVIEGRIRQQNSGLRISLSLVDARTALVSLDHGYETDGKKAELKSITGNFINQITVLIAPSLP